jgi:hypothetical protein
VKDWEKVLGPATRVVRDISVWDELGVYVYHDTGRPNPAELDLLLSRTHLSPATIDERDFWPRGSFRGRLVVDGAPITTGTTVGDINARKNGAPFRRGHLPSIFESESGGFLLGISVGFDGRLRTFSMSPASRN